MINEIKLALGKELRKSFKNEKIYTEKIRQGIKFPCFYLKYINKETQTVAYIDYSETYKIDIMYMKDLNQNDDDYVFSSVISKLESLTQFIFNDTKVKVNLYETDIVDGVLHYIVDILVPINNKNKIQKSKNETCILISNIIEKVSGKKVYYINGDLEEIDNGFFVLEPDNLKTESYGITAIKQKERVINIRYTSKDISLDIPDFLEKTMDKVISDIKLISEFRKFNYEIDIDYDNEEFNGFNVLSHELSLNLVERKK